MGDGCEPRKSSGFQLPNEWLRIVGGRLPLGNAACFGNAMLSGTYIHECFVCGTRYTGTVKWYMVIGKAQFVVDGSCLLAASSSSLASASLPSSSTTLLTDPSLLTTTVVWTLWNVCTELWLNSSSAVLQVGIHCVYWRGLGLSPNRGVEPIHLARGGSQDQWSDPRTGNRTPPLSFQDFSSPKMTKNFCYQRKIWIYVT